MARKQQIEALGHVVEANRTVRVVAGILREPGERTEEDWAKIEAYLERAMGHYQVARNIAQDGAEMDDDQPPTTSLGSLLP